MKIIPILIVVAVLIGYVLTTKPESLSAKAVDNPTMHRYDVTSWTQDTPAGDVPVPDYESQFAQEWFESFKADLPYYTVLYYSSKGCVPCRTSDKQVAAALMASHWYVLKYDVDRSPRLAEMYAVEEIPLYIALVDGKEVGRVLAPTSPLQVTDLFGVARPMQAAVSDGNYPAVRREVSRPSVRPGYPLRGNLWTVNGGHPGREGLIRHLMSGQHRGKFDRGWLQTLSLAELSSLHSDDHQGRVSQQHVRRPGQRRSIAPAPRSQASCPHCPRRRG